MTARVRSRWGRSARAIVAMVVTAVVLTAVLLPATTALAQTATSLPPANPYEDPDPLNAGGIVFIGVSAVLFGGALLLYLRHRPRARS